MAMKTVLALFALILAAASAGASGSADRASALDQLAALGQSGSFDDTGRTRGWEIPSPGDYDPRHRPDADGYEDFVSPYAANRDNARTRMQDDVTPPPGLSELALQQWARTHRREPTAREIGRALGVDVPDPQVAGGHLDVGGTPHGTGAELRLKWNW